MNIFIKFFQYFYKELIAIKYFFIMNYPNSYFGLHIRKKFWSKRLKKCGKNNCFQQKSGLGFPELIEIGSNFFLGDDSLITANSSKGIFIGDNVGIARGTYIHSANHSHKDINIPIFEQDVISEDFEYNGRLYSVVIEDDVWIGSNVVVLSGTKIGKGCVISAGSVVSGTLPDYSIVVGNPARVVKSRK